MQDPDPQTLPGGDAGSEDGLPQESQEPVASVGPVVDETTQRLKDLEDKNKDLQRRLTQQGRDLAEYRRSSSSPQSTQANPAGFFENPEAVIEAKLRDFEQRQEQRRQAEDMLREFAEEKGIPVRELKRLNEELQGAAVDPVSYLETLAKFHQAKNAANAVQDAAKSATQSAQKNARAVMAEGGASQAMSPSKPESEMSIDERRAALIKQYGIEKVEGS